VKKPMTLDDELLEDAIKAMIVACHHRHRLPGFACVCDEMIKKFETRWRELVALSTGPRSPNE
jgi:hypothetical protein